MTVKRNILPRVQNIASATAIANIPAKPVLATLSNALGSLGFVSIFFLSSTFDDNVDDKDRFM